ncbi:ASCC3 protein, partial [Polypterus senegalus]|nr:ASCC3 protein [Polypterus senegalus]
MVGDEYGQEMIESAAVFLFKVFYDKDQVGHEETRAIKQMFGPFPLSSVDAACSAINKVARFFEETQIETFLKVHSISHLKDQVPFGKNISFSFDMYSVDTFLDMSLQMKDNEDTKGFSLDYEKYLNNQQEQQKAVFVNTVDLKSPQGIDGSFLSREVDRYLLHGTLGSPNASDLCTTLFEMLTSNKSDDELQNELFELLGPEGFELIEKLLQNRFAIVEIALNTVPDVKLNNFHDAAKRGIADNTTKPIYGCQVKIQSEQEKQLFKQYRREEKKLAKKEKKGDDSEFSGETSIHFDPKELRLQR